MKYVILVWLLGNSLLLSAQTDSTTTFKVSGLCAMCKERIENASKGKGVVSAIWDVDTKLLTIQYDPSITNPEKVQQRIADAGHDTELKKAKDYVYKSLPECCWYRDPVKQSEAEEGGDDHKVMGVVMETDAKGNFKALTGATVLQKGTNNGVTTNENGFFTITPDALESALVISYAGFQSKDITVTRGQHLNIVLNPSTGLQEVKVVAHLRSSYVANKSLVRTIVMTEKELFKAACCNLSESFETSPSVDVSYNDAVTGSKQIQLLGLAGNYTQLTLENLPGPRGLATPLGLSYVPGTWVESIQLTKGPGPVTNGFESIAGQINVELKKPEQANRLFANLYINSMGKTDMNVNLAQRVGKNWSTALLVHDAFLNNKVDFNKDGFRDLPTGNLFTIMNRWKYDNQKGWMGQIGVRFLNDDKTGGQMDFTPAKDKLTTNHYGLGIATKRYEAFAKIGYVFPEKKYKSIGLQLSAFRHEQNSYFGLNMYDAKQNNFYSNLIYQSIIGATHHKFRTGISLVADQYNETVKNTGYKRNEIVPGVFYEHTYSPSEKIDIVAGLRADHNNLYGWFVTPRLHVRYEPIAGTVLRLSSGRGQRTANIFAENTGVLVSARTITILNPSTNKAYGLNPEVAWSTGISLDQKFKLNNRSGTIGIDFYRTDFQNQVVVDMDKSAQQVNFYNLQGKSYSNSFQGELSYELAKKLDMRMAWRIFDVKTNYHGELLRRPLVAKDRGFFNLAYTSGTWKLDYTLTYNGTKRVPYTESNPVRYQFRSQSPSYVLMNAQVTKTIGNKFPVDIYIGGENLTNYFQKQAIIAPDQPFGQYFDASLVWGPVFGRMLYGGVRVKM